MRMKNVLISFTLVLILTVLLSGYVGNQTAYGSSDLQRIIQTYGEAELTAQPDLARIGLAIETRSRLAKDSVKENARLANAVREALLDFGLSEENLKTGSYRLYSYREWQKESPDIEEEQIYYQVTNEIIVSTTQLDVVGEIIDLAVRAGANNINYINFELKDPQDLMMQALKMATEQASRKANAIAEGAGETIAKLHSVREERTTYTPFRFQENVLQREVAADVGATPIAPDEVTVRAAPIWRLKKRASSPAVMPWAMGRLSTPKKDL